MPQPGLDRGAVEQNSLRCGHAVTLLAFGQRRFAQFPPFVVQQHPTIRFASRRGLFDAGQRIGRQLALLHQIPRESFDRRQVRMHRAGRVLLSQRHGVVIHVGSLDAGHRPPRARLDDLANHRNRLPDVILVAAGGGQFGLVFLHVFGQPPPMVGGIGQAVRRKHQLRFPFGPKLFGDFLVGNAGGSKVAVAVIEIPRARSSGVLPSRPRHSAGLPFSESAELSPQVISFPAIQAGGRMGHNFGPAN